MTLYFFAERSHSEGRCMKDVPSMSILVNTVAAPSSGYENAAISGAAVWAEHFRSINNKARSWMTVSAMLAILTLTNRKVSGEVNRVSQSSMKDADKAFGSVLGCACRSLRMVTHPDASRPQGESARALVEIISNSVVGQGEGLLYCLTRAVIDASDNLKFLVDKMCLRRNSPPGLVRSCPKPSRPVDLLHRLGAPELRNIFV